MNSQPTVADVTKARIRKRNSDTTLDKALTRVITSAAGPPRADAVGAVPSSHAYELALTLLSSAYHLLPAFDRPRISPLYNLACLSRSFPPTHDSIHLPPSGFFGCFSCASESPPTPRRLAFFSSSVYEVPLRRKASRHSRFAGTVPYPVLTGVTEVRKREPWPVVQ